MAFGMKSLPKRSSGIALYMKSFVEQSSEMHNGMKFSLKILIGIGGK